jgi:preprotein translocase subunit SecD
VARSGSTSRPIRSILGLAVVFAIIFGWIAIGTVKSDASWAPKLALDLEGGTEVILTPEATTGNVQPTQAQLDEAVNIIRQRVNGSGVSEAEVTTQGSSKIVVSLPGKSVDQKTLDLVKQSAELNFRSVIVVAPAAPQPDPAATPAPGASPSPAASPGATPSGSASPAASAAAESTPAPKATNSRVVPRALLNQAAAATPGSATADPAADPAPVPAPDPSAGAGTSDPNAGAAGTNSDLQRAITTKTISPITGPKATTIEEQFTALTCTQEQINALKAEVADKTKPVVTCSTDGTEKLILGPVEVAGTEIASASSGLATNQQGFSTGEWEVKLSFKSAGAKQFSAVTERLAGLTGSQNQFAIVLDGLVVSHPGVNERIPTGEASITGGGFDQASTSTLASQLKFGSLPISFRVETQNQISATLGSEQLQRGLLAGVIGLVLVVLYSLAQYRALGLVTVFSLVLAAGITYGLVALLSWQQGFRLSLAGVAGLIVSIGITADSFIVYFERVRDEVRDGRPLRSAVEAGWIRARRTILVSDAVNFSAAIVLYILAVGGVRGFAFTLGLTTLVDIVIVFLFTKPMVTLLSRTAFFDGGHALSGFSASQLGRAVPSYAGRGRVTAPAAARQSIAERRAAAAADSAPPGGRDPGDPGPEGAGTGDSGATSGSAVRAGSRRDI